MVATMSISDASNAGVENGGDSCHIEEGAGNDNEVAASVVMVVCQGSAAAGGTDGNFGGLVVVRNHFISFPQNPLIYLT